jgi:succinoglycan biosynthesis protein ExoO
MTSTDDQTIMNIASVSEAPQISVIIAAYNCAPYLATAIESALGQSGLTLEILVVDDASTDKTAEIASRYEKNGQIRLLVNEVNRGPSFSRNRAIQAARGEWVAQLDGDDWFAPERLRTLLQLAIDNQADIVADDLLMVEDHTLQPMSTCFIDNGVPWHTAKSITSVDLIKYDLGPIKPLIRRAFLVEHALSYQEEVVFGEDFLLLLKAMLLGAQVTILPSPMYHLRRGNTGSLTTQRNRLFQQIENTTIELLANPEISYYPLIVKALTNRLKKVRKLAMLEHVVQLTKQRHFSEALSKVFTNPKLIIVVLHRTLEIISTRMRRYFHRRILKRAYSPPMSSIPNITS